MRSHAYSLLKSIYRTAVAGPRVITTLKSTAGRCSVYLLPHLL